ncbi:hypothetical protein ACFLZY_00350 [Patescibacteria group bacterium]
MSLTQKKQRILEGVRQRGGLVSDSSKVDLRRQQAWRYWENGFVHSLRRYNSFEEYLAQVPPVPQVSSELLKKFKYWVLIDARVDFRVMCRLLQIEYNYTQRFFEDRYLIKQLRPNLHWILCQDGHGHQDKSAAEWLEFFVANKDEIPLTAREGLFLYAQYPEVISSDHQMELPGSLEVNRPNNCPYLFQAQRRQGAKIINLACLFSGGINSIAFGYGTASRLAMFFDQL